MQTALPAKYTSVNQYMDALSPAAKAMAQQLRQIIANTAPTAQETISYNMPAFTLQGILIWYAGYKKHIGFYPKAAAIEVFKEELSAYKTSKGAVQFPLNSPLPVELITKMVLYRVKENTEKAGKR
jgi:uncharacterized protein YdhG (YjbR/CyaY superfamily)